MSTRLGVYVPTLSSGGPATEAARTAVVQGWTTATSEAPGVAVVALAVGFSDAAAVELWGTVETGEAVGDSVDAADVVGLADEVADAESGPADTAGATDPVPDGVLPPGFPVHAASSTRDAATTATAASGPDFRVCVLMSQG
ncbi:hypothetical protein [Propionibacterium sp.]|uniref:hypothetical protein n=1 Tax=Propionibacterium sp. TaxID=1977903 RepID=UPI0039E73419